MKKFLLTTLVVAAIFSGAKAQVYDWARQMGGTDFDIGRSIVVDATGNVYTTGFFQGTANFDPGEGTFNLTAEGDRDIFVSKLNSTGNFVWAKQLRGLDQGIGYSIAVDATGNIYTTGYFAGTVDFDPGEGSTSLTASGYNDVFISKLNSEGNSVWAKNIGGTNASSTGFSITVDELGNIYTTGSFTGTADFDPGAGIENLTADGSQSDIFVSKLDSNGNYLWAKRMGGSGSDHGSSIVVGTSGNVYTTGSFRQTGDFDPGSDTFNLTATGDESIFISKLDPSGNFLWARQLGGETVEYDPAIAVDATENVYTAGNFHDTADFDPGMSTFNLTSVGDRDVFVSKLDSSGNFLWAKQMGGIFADIAQSIAVDVSGNVYTVGTFGGTADFNPGADADSLTSAGGGDAFISTLDSDGNFLWAVRMGGVALESAHSITVDAFGKIYTTGYFGYVADFDPGTGTANLTSSGSSDIFVSKFTLNTTGTGILKDSFDETLHLYPNPTTGNFRVDLGANYQDVNIVLTDITGKSIKTKSMKNANIISMRIDDVSAGVYILLITEASGNAAFIRLVKD